jgi:hypothetical protein
MVGRLVVGVFPAGVARMTAGIWEGRAVRVWATDVRMTSTAGVETTDGEQAPKNMRSRVKAGRRRFICITPGLAGMRRNPAESCLIII